MKVLLLYTRDYILLYMDVSEKRFHSNEAFFLFNKKHYDTPFISFLESLFHFIMTFFTWWVFRLKRFISNEGALHPFKKLFNKNEAFSLMKRKLSWHPLPFIPRLCFSFVMEFFSWLPLWLKRLIWNENAIIVYVSLHSFRPIFKGMYSSFITNKSLQSNNS